MTKKIYLIDGYGFVFRAYHSMPPLTNPEGTPVGAVYGFTNMLIKLLREQKPDYMAVVYDAGRQTFRHKIYSEYKANRPPAPEDLIPQFPLVREASKALGIKNLEMEGFEADDIIATLAARAKRENLEVIVVSSDKDLMQLIGQGVGMYDAMRNRKIGEAEVREKFGVGPDKVLDVLSLMGDSSDNVPGVPGIGPKTAAELINTYGSLDELLVRAGEIKQDKRRQTIIDNTDKAKLSRELISLHYDVPLELEFEDLKTKYIDAELFEFCKKQGFKSLVAKLSDVVKDTPNPTIVRGEVKAVVKKEVPRVDTICADVKALEEWLKARKIEELAVYKDEGGVALATEGAACFIKFGKGGNDLFATNELTLETIYSALKPVFANPLILKIFHDLKSNFVNAEPFDDVQIMYYVTLTGIAEAEIEFVEPELPIMVFGSGKNKKTHADFSADELAKFAIPRAAAIYKHYARFKKELFDSKQLTVYHAVDKPLIGVLYRMEKRGAKIDVPLLKSFSADFEQKMAILEKDIHQMAGKEFNVGSPSQLGEVLFDDLKLPGGRKSKKTGNYTTDASTLDELAEQGIEIAGKVLEWRQLSKLKSTYTDSLPNQINPKNGQGAYNIPHGAYFYWALEFAKSEFAEYSDSF